MSEKKSTYKYCYVPKCESTSIKTPDKLFLSVPKDKKKRILWCKVARRADIGRPNNHYYCCEDHFNLEDDLVNYIRLKIMGPSNVKHLKLKPNVIPHKFDCQTDRKQITSTLPTRVVYKKRARRDLVDAAVNNTPEYNINNSNEVNDFINDLTPPEPLSKEVGVQVNIIKNTCTINKPKPSTRSKSSQCDLGLALTKTISSVKFGSVKHKEFDENSELESTLNSSLSNCDSPSNVSCSSSQSYIEEFFIENESNKYKKLSYEVICYHIQNNPKHYIGLTHEWFKHGFITLLSSNSKISERDILLTLTKIRLNDSFSRLGDIFGVSESYSCRIFSKTINRIVGYFKEFIYWPNKDTIIKLLPIPFRYRYSNTQAIIDCLEIEIPKPSDPVQQSLTWSDYKKCNTLKYLISCTPDGFINFISVGYGGRCSDVLLVEKCGFLDLVPENSDVMADRGFKNIDHMLSLRKCKLVRPPSVSQSQISTKQEVLETKRIASLRIHIERVIGRLREFSTLKPHALMHINLVSNVDEIIIIDCALINLQKSIITQ